MKSFVIVLALVAAACAQGNNPDTISVDLVNAQRDLDTTYSFFQNSYVRARTDLSEILFSIQGQVMESFLEAYADAKALESSTTTAMAAFPVNACTNIVRNRWNISIRRYGAQLSGCLRSATTLLYPITQFLNVESVESQRSTNFVMNLGVDQLGQLQSFTAGATNVPAAINRNLRDFFFRVQLYIEGHEEFVREIVNDRYQIIQGLIECDQVTLAQFYYETINVLERAGNC